MSQPASRGCHDDRVALVSTHPSEGLVVEVYEAERDGYYVRAATSPLDRLSTVSAFVRAS